MTQLRERFRITQPFHRRYGEEFDLIRYRRSWGHKGSVDGRGQSGERVSFPLSWTDAAPQDPLVAMVDGRSYFRVDDLLRLGDLLEDLSR